MSGGHYCLQLVQHPRVLERRLAHLRVLFLELLDRALVNAAALVNQVPGGGRLARRSRPSSCARSPCPCCLLNCCVALLRSAAQACKKGGLVKGVEKLVLPLTKRSVSCGNDRITEKG